MKNTTAYIVAGSILGLVVGSSMGIAVGGTAYNAAFFLMPLGGFIGWLLAARNGALSTSKAEINTEQAVGSIEPQPEPTSQPNAGLQLILHSVLTIFATVWNFQIDVLKILGLLPTFVRQPLLFAGLCVVISVIFPPFLFLYFFAWLAANHFGLTAENQFRSVIV